MRAAGGGAGCSSPGPGTSPAETRSGTLQHNALIMMALIMIMMLSVSKLLTMLDVSVWGEEQPGAEPPERGHDGLHQRGPATRGSLLVLANLSPAVPAVKRSVC